MHHHEGTTESGPLSGIDGGWLLLALCGTVAGFAGLIFTIDALVGLALLANLAAATGLSRSRRQPLSPDRLQGLAELAHELRSPLWAILGYAEELDPDDPSSHPECIAAIKRNSCYLGRLLEEAFGADSNARSTTATNLRSLLTDMSAPLAAKARAKGVQFTMPIAKNVPEILVIDADGVRQVLTNLLANAVAFTDCGAIDVSIRHEENELVVQVDDSGCGIPPNALPSIFRPFDRGDHAFTPIKPRAPALASTSPVASPRPWKAPSR